MQYTNKELEMARKIRKITGKKLKTCLFCIRYRHGNFHKALQLCSDDSKEGDRRNSA